MQAFHHLHWSNPGVSAGPFMCIVTQAHEFLQDRGLIAFYVVPYPVIYHLVTGLYVRSAFSYLSRLIETQCFMKATEHSLPLWSSLKLFHLLIFHPVPFQSFRVSEDIPLEEEYLRGTVCLLSVFWLKKKEGSPLLTFFCLPEHIRLSASSCTGHSLHSHSFKGWIEVGCFFFWPPLWPAVVWCKCMCRHRAGRSRVPLLCEGWSALWMWPWAGKRAIQSILWHPMHGTKRKICLEGKIIPPMWKKKAGF